MKNTANTKKDTGGQTWKRLKRITIVDFVWHETVIISFASNFSTNIWKLTLKGTCNRPFVLVDHVINFR